MRIMPTGSVPLYHAAVHMCDSLDGICVRFICPKPVCSAAVSQLPALCMIPLNAAMPPWDGWVYGVPCGHTARGAMVCPAATSNGCPGATCKPALLLLLSCRHFLMALGMYLQGLQGVRICLFQ
jgi:hypothetical protein